MDRGRDRLLLRLLRSEPIFYTLSGVFAGGGIERAVSILAEHENALQGVAIPDIISALLLIVVGLFFALVADETEKYEASVTRQTDLVRFRIVLDVSQKKQHLSQENLVAFIEDTVEEERKHLEPRVKDRERQWRSRAIRWLLFGTAFIALSVVVTIPSQRTRGSVEHPIISLKCSPCTIAPGETALVTWYTDRARQVFLNDQRVPDRGSVRVGPEDSTTYDLRAVGLKGEAQTEVTVFVQERSTSTPTSKPSIVPAPTDSRD